VICNTPLSGYQRKYCSDECRNTHKEYIKEQRKTECVICGIVFISNRRRKTCSDECGLELKKKTDREWRVKEQVDYYITKKQVKTRPCLKCGKDFETTVDWICPSCHEANERLYGGVDECYTVGRNTQWKRAKVSQI
jgi:predicted nucleic acid-binding Zn ribbon protein